MNRFSWATAAKIAWRDCRASAFKFAFVIFGVAAGVGALTGVRGFSEAFRSILLREARTLMAADLTVRVFGVPSPAQLEAMEAYRQRGAAMAHLTETVTMMSSAAAETDPVLVSVKAVEPELYPFYGQVKLDPEQKLRDALTPESVLISDDLLLRLNIQVGSMVRFGGKDYRVAAVVKNEPDRMTGSLNVGPRIMVSRAGLERAGLVQFGSRAAERFLFKLPPQGIDVAEMRATLKRKLPDALVADHRETHPAITRVLDRSTTFLSLVSLIALIVGALGVATAIHSHLQQRLDSIAIMKCLGAKSSQIIRIYAMETLGLGLAGGVAGVAVGALVQLALPALLARYFKFEQGVGWSSSFALEGILAGVLVTLLFTLPPLLDIRKVRPALIFRREMPEVRLPFWKRWRASLPSVVSGAVILAGICGVAAWLAKSPQVGTYFVLGLTAALLVLSLVAWLLLRGLRVTLKSSPLRLPVTLRHGLANLYRPGNHAGAVLVALGIGVMFTLTIFLVQRSIVTEVANTAPPGAPNVFMINITEREIEGVKAVLRDYAEGGSQPSLPPLVSARLVTVDGMPLDELQLKGFGRRWMQSRPVTYSDTVPKDLIVRQGAWWSVNESTARVAVSEDAAQALKLRIGSRLGWTASGKSFEAVVSAVFRGRAVTSGIDWDFLLSRSALNGFPMQYFGAVRVPASRVNALQRAVYAKHPTVTVINAADIMAIVQEVIDQVALIVRFISGFAILAGAIILAATVAGTRLRRVREAAILKTLGARRSRLIGIFSVEFLVLGTVAGLMGSILATVFSRLLLTRLLEAEFRVDVAPNLAAIALTALLAVSTGWAASLRLLDRRPLEVLRDE